LALSVFGLNAAFLYERFAGFARFAVPGLARFAVLGLARFAVPGLARFAVPGLARFAVACLVAAGLGVFLARAVVAAVFGSFFRDALRFRFSGFEFRRLTMKCLAASRTVDGSSLVQRIAEVPPTGALGLEGIVAADDAVPVVGVVGSEAATHGTALGG
jgi:hypothetical protein